MPLITTGKMSKTLTGKVKVPKLKKPKKVKIPKLPRLPKLGRADTSLSKLLKSGL